MYEDELNDIIPWLVNDEGTSISAVRSHDGETWLVEFTNDGGIKADVSRRTDGGGWSPELSVRFTADWWNLHEDTDGALGVLTQALRDGRAFEALQVLVGAGA